MLSAHSLANPHALCAALPPLENAQDALDAGSGAGGAPRGRAGRGGGGGGGLARHRARLAYDALAVAAGLRSVAMADYALCAPAALARALGASGLSAGAGGGAAAALGAAAAGRQLQFVGGVLALDGCCYVADLARLAARLEALLVSEPGSDGAGPEAAGGGGAAAAAEPLIGAVFADGAPALAGADDLRLLRVQLARLLPAIRRAAAEAAASAAAAAGESAAGAATDWPVVDLGEVPALPCMPTLNGWLLGYPVVYIVAGREAAAAAARALSGAALRRVAVRAACPALARRLEAGGNGGNVGGGEGGDELLAFTIPEALCGGGAVDDACAALLARVRGAARRGGPVRWDVAAALHVGAAAPGAVAL